MQTIFIRICADTPANIAFKKYFSLDLDISQGPVSLILMAWHKSALSPVSKQLSYCSPVLNYLKYFLENLFDEQKHFT